MFLEFYAGAGTDNAGRTFDQIMEWSDHQWEATHDFIQWVFPTRRPSAFNNHAPIVTPELIQTFRASPGLQTRLKDVAYPRFRAFLTMDSNTHPWWCHPNNHNLLRVTRVLDCLTTWGIPALDSEALSFLTELMTLGKYADVGQAQTFWQLTVNNNLCR